MDRCRFCGDEIAFRRIDGETRVIRHHCDGGRGSGPRVYEKHRWSADNDFCRPTKCPNCNNPVFFVRHNGGSVWLDELGPPWPIHGCFEGNRHARRLTDLLRRVQRPARDVVFGIIREARERRDRFSAGLSIRCCDNTLIEQDFCSVNGGKLTEWPGSLVVIGSESGVIRLVRFPCNPFSLEGHIDQRLLLRFEAKDCGVLDDAVVALLKSCQDVGGKVEGPYPLPTRVEPYTVLRSPPIDRKSREMFEVRTYKRMITLVNPSPSVVAYLGSHRLADGVEVKMREFTTTELHLTEV